MFANCFAEVCTKDGKNEYILLCQDQRLRLLDSATLLKDVQAGRLQVGNMSIYNGII